jgi:protein TonB
MTTPRIFAGVALAAVLSSCTGPTTTTETRSAPPRTAVTGTVEEIASLDVPPKQTKPLRPQYPFALKKAGITGEAVVEFIVDTSGTPRDLRVVSATHPEFGQAAVAAFQELHYSPGMKNGVPVNTRLRQPVRFSVSAR